jgi:1-Cys peroxiredoxin 6
MYSSKAHPPPSPFTQVCASVGSVQGFVVDIKAATGFQVDFPIICDESKELAVKLGLMKGDGSSMRGVIFADADFHVSMSMNYPRSCGINFHEVLRLVDSVQLTEKHRVWTPVNWVRGQNVMVGPEVDERTADNQHDSVQRIDLPSGKTYLRVVRDPSGL